MALYAYKDVNEEGEYVIEYDNLSASMHGGDTYPQIWASKNLTQYRSHYDSEWQTTEFFFLYEADFVAFKLRYG